MTRFHLGQWFFPLIFAASVGISSQPLAFADPGDVNSVTKGQVVPGGTYYNTPGGKTTFTNNGSGGLWIKNGSTVRGLEVSNPSNPAGSLTNNGGTLHFYAPGSVVRVDGTIDVSGMRNSGGSYIGNGGKILVDASVIIQSGSGQIYANGIKGA